MQEVSSPTRYGTHALAGEAIDRTLFDINQSNVFVFFFFFILCPTVMETKAERNKWDLIKLKRFYAINKKQSNKATY